jgi:hypothetical protein
MIRVQLLSELEEIIEYKRNANQPARQAIMRKTWSKRLSISSFNYTHLSYHKAGSKGASVILTFGRELFSYED